MPVKFLIKPASCFVFILSTFAHAEWSEVHPGLFTTNVELPGALAPRLKVFKFRQSAYLLEPVYSKSDPYVLDAIKNSDALLAINAMFYSKELKPLGSLVIGGKRFFSPQTRGSLLTGLLCISKAGKVSIVHRSRGCGEALHELQAGPRLISNSKAIPLKNPNKKANRTGIAIDSRGDVVVYTSISIIPPSLAEVVEMLGELGIVDALNLDGGGSSQMYLRQDNKIKTIKNAGDPAPVSLVVRKRES